MFEVRVVTDVNARDGIVPLEGRFTYDSSAPMVCTTSVTCGTAFINFDRIRWNVRDGDTHTMITAFNGTASQLGHVQRDTNGATNGTGTRHRNYFQYIFNNQDLLPAGTYEGTVTLTGEGIF